MAKNYDRDENDAYFTPAWCVDQCIVEVLPKFLHVPWGVQEHWRVLDAGAGKGIFGQRLRHVEYPAAMYIVGVEINPDFHEKGHYSLYSRIFKGDFLQCSSDMLGGVFTLAIGNPPYKMAAEFAQHCISMSEWTVLFLRQGFMSSKKRSAWFKAHPPASVHVLANRPTFEGSTSDQSDYCWIVWNRRPWHETKLYWLDPVPANLRGKR